MTIPSGGVAVSLDKNLMQTLASNATETIYWDFSATENFYSFTGGILYRVSPNYVYNWFINNPESNANVTIYYNPFLGAFQNQMQKISNIT